jgi:[histone H3]-lysine36 N-dimethyltransferase SETMAR
MPKYCSIEVEVLVREFSRRKCSLSVIKKQLKERGHEVSLQSISNIINCKGIKRQAEAAGRIPPPKEHPLKEHTKSIIPRLKRLSSSENPKTQRDIASRLGTSKSTINRVIKKYLGKVTRRKHPVHRLTASHMQNRKTNARKLYENHLAGDKDEYVITIDEALFKVQVSNKERKICYRRRGEKIPISWVCQRTESFGEQLMVIGALSGRGPLPLMKVPKNAKINADRYIEDVLRPIVEKEIPRLYPGEEHKVFIHHDAASSHTAKKTVDYGKRVKENFGPTLISNQEIPVKSPDISPMDFFGFGFLKQKLFQRRATTLNGVWKSLNEEWNKVTPEKAQEVFSSWKKRCRAVVKNNGRHIEQTNHSRKIR